MSGRRREVRSKRPSNGFGSIAVDFVPVPAQPGLRLALIGWSWRTSLQEVAGQLLLHPQKQSCRTLTAAAAHTDGLPLLSSSAFRARLPLGGESFGGELLVRRRFHHIRRWRGSFFLDLGEQPGLNRGGCPVSLGIVTGEAARLDDYGAQL